MTNEQRLEKLLMLEAQKKELDALQKKQESDNWERLMGMEDRVKEVCAMSVRLCNVGLLSRETKNINGVLEFYPESGVFNTNPRNTDKLFGDREGFKGYEYGTRVLLLKNKCSFTYENIMEHNVKKASEIIEAIEEIEDFVFSAIDNA